MDQENGLAFLSRRHFLFGSAAFASSTSLYAFGSTQVDSAAPRGKQRNLLAKSYTPEKLKQSLIRR
jgi:hypothetical protein